MPWRYVEADRIVLNALFPIACPISVKIRDSMITASDGTGPIIYGAVHAFKQLTNFNLSSDDTVLVKPNILLPTTRIFWNFPYRISSLRLQSIAGEPLLLDVNESNYQEEEKVSVYKGKLKLSWKEARLFFPARDKSSNVSDVKLILRFRVDNANDSLDCYDAADPGDNNQLICAFLSGILENPILGYLKFLMINAKSNNPIRSDDSVPGDVVPPANYQVRKAKLTICRKESIP
ncbi:MAG: hypothetical protein AB1424_09030 [Thermodesulfobacteriota bacterium]